MTQRCCMCYESVLDGLAHSGCVKKIFGVSTIPELSFDETQITQMAIQLLGQKMGLPGVQKKISATLIRDKQNGVAVPRLTVVGVFSGEFIFKPPSITYPHMPEVEDLTMHLASLAKIEVAEHTLIPFDGQYGYVTKRFDRKKHHIKVPVEDLCQLSEKKTDDKYKSSMEKVGRLIANYATYLGDASNKFLELTLFNFIVGNADMHLKNFALITEPNYIRISPAYDLLSTKLLIPHHVDTEEIALPLNGKKTNLRKKDFKLFSKSIGVSDIVFEKKVLWFQKILPSFDYKIEQSFLPAAMKIQFKKEISERFSRLL